MDDKWFELYKFALQVNFNLNTDVDDLDKEAIHQIVSSSVELAHFFYQEYLKHSK